MEHFLGVLRCLAQVSPQCEEHTFSPVRFSSSIQSQCWFKVGGLHSTISEVHNLIKTIHFGCGWGFLTVWFYPGEELISCLKAPFFLCFFFFSLEIQSDFRLPVQLRMTLTI